MKLYTPALDCTPQDVNNCSFKKAFLNKFEKTYMLTFYGCFLESHQAYQQAALEAVFPTRIWRWNIMCVCVCVCVFKGTHTNIFQNQCSWEQSFLNIYEAIKETGVYMWQAHVTKLMGWAQLPLCQFQCDLKP